MSEVFAVGSAATPNLDILRVRLSSEVVMRRQAAIKPENLRVETLKLRRRAILEIEIRNRASSFRESVPFSRVLNRRNYVDRLVAFRHNAEQSGDNAAYEWANRRLLTDSYTWKCTPRNRADLNAIECSRDCIDTVNVRKVQYWIRHCLPVSNVRQSGDMHPAIELFTRTSSSCVGLYIAASLHRPETSNADIVYVSQYMGSFPLEAIIFLVRWETGCIEIDTSEFVVK